MIEVSQAIPYRGIRKSIGKRMEISGAYPMTYQGMYVDVTELLAYRKQVNAKKGVSLTVNDFIVKAVSLALQRTPIMNSAFNEDMSQILVYSNYNISVMTASDKGLVAPVIKESEKKSIYQISEEMKALVEKANAGKLMPEDYAGGTFGVTNLGKLNSFDSVPLPQDVYKRQVQYIVPLSKSIIVIIYRRVFRQVIAVPSAGRRGQRRQAAGLV